MTLKQQLKNLHKNYIIFIPVLMLVIEPMMLLQFGCYRLATLLLKVKVRVLDGHFPLQKTEERKSNKCPSAE